MPNRKVSSRASKKLPELVAQAPQTHPDSTRIEIWWQVEARVGQENKHARHWAQRSTPHDQRIRSAYIFGAICPERGIAVAMQQHLEEISAEVRPGAHALLILDRAGWHTTKKRDIPANITLLPLPPRSPKLNPTENIW